MKRKLQFSLILFVILSPVFSQQVEISGNKFQVNGNDIFFNAISGPWQWRADCDINFMRRDFDWDYWNSEFQRYSDNHINLVRIWLHGSGDFSPAINSGSYVEPYGSGDQFWQDMDALVALAETYSVYIMPTFWSFDMVKEGMSDYYQNYWTLIQDDNRMGSYIDNFLIPFLQRYEGNPWVMGYDLVNEPEHMWRDADCGNLNQYWVMRFFARCAAAVNENSSKPVTIGSMWIVYNSPNFGSPDGDPEAGWNRYTDSSLQSYYNNSNAYLDFYSPHWYQWQNTSGPYERTVYEWLGSDDKPVVIGETYGGDLPGVFGTLTDYYLNAVSNGFDGVVGWKNACQNDGYGTWAGVSPATNAFYNAYPHLVYPNMSSTNENIAFNKPVFSSSTESLEYDASNAVDADGETRWSSSYIDPQWIYVDLLQEYDVSRVKLDWEAAYAKQFQIQISTDNQNWTTVYSNYSFQGGVTDVSLNETARYVKVYGWERATEWGYSLYEFEIYGSLANLKSSVVQIYDSEAQKQNMFLVGPNPADESIWIRGVEGVEVVRLLDLSGKIIMETKKDRDSSGLKLPSGAVPEGIYFINAGNKVKKIIIKH